MHKKIFSLAMLALMLVGLFAIPNVFAATPTMYMEATKTTGLTLGEKFYVTVLFKDFTDLYCWQVGISWDPAVLQVDGPVLFFQAMWNESVFAVLAPTRTTVAVSGTINNTAGQIYPPFAESLTGEGGVNGTPGTCYKLMKVPFKVIGFASTGTTIDFIEVGPYGPWIVSGWIQWPLLDLIKPAYESLTVSTIVPTELSVSISPLSASILVGQSVTFTSTVSGGYTPYSYQWYLNDNPVSGATSDTWIFTPTTRGIYYVHLRVTDAKANTAQSDSARITTATVPVGGYSIPIQAPAVAKPLTPYLILTAILTIAFTTIKHKTKRKTKKPQ